MQTVRQNIRYFYEYIVLPHYGAIAHLAKAAVALLAIALALECFVFNFNYFASAGYQPIDLASKIKLAKNPEDEFRVTSVNHVLEFSNLNTEVHDVMIDFSADQPAQVLDVKIQFTDDAHLTYFDTTEYTVGVPVAKIATTSEQSQYINLKTAGYVNNLRIEIGGEDASYPVYLNTVYLNARHPFCFEPIRFAFALGLLVLIFMFRPKSAVWRIRIVENAKESKAAIIAANAVEAVLLCAFLLYGSNMVGIATASYNYGEWDGVSLVNTYQVGGDNAQQYSELARSMAEGRLYLDEEPPEWLQEMSDPYDKGARDEAQKETGEPYLFDVAYHDGHYYVYFGVVPVILFYLPFYLLTGSDFPTALGVGFAACMFLFGCSALLDRFARYHFKRVSLGIYLVLQAGVVFCSGMLYLVKFPTFYSLPIACGLAFSVWGLYFWMRGRTARKRTSRCGAYLAGSLCMALVAGCRPQLLVLSLLAFPLFWRPYISEKRLFSKKGAGEFACLIAPYLVVAAGIMLYNHARFGSFFDFGANYNLTVNDMTKRGWNVGRLAPAFFSYFLQPPNMAGEFPFLQPCDFATTYMGQTIKEATFGGILACLPMLWIAFFARPIVRMRNEQRATHTVSGVIGVLLAGGVLVALVDAEMAGILQRYYADFSFMFLAVVALLVFIVNENLVTETPERRRLYACTLMALVGLSLVYSALLSFAPEIGWYSDIYPFAYVDLVEMVQFWT